ncbi:hypothetical protein B0J18DRAFT_25780 [Chaetomium sp. MPI-SDFR-AT-0129]|nr:hypothetical protein B0J18DRAFT_25780 [Chaetomium sp. MPI-SDFR-AT-0129]
MERFAIWEPPKETHSHTRRERKSEGEKHTLLVNVWEYARDSGDFRTARLRSTRLRLSLPSRHRDEAELTTPGRPFNSVPMDATREARYPSNSLDIGPRCRFSTFRRKNSSQLQPFLRGHAMLTCVKRSFVNNMTTPSDPARWHVSSLCRHSSRTAGRRSPQTGDVPGELVCVSKLTSRKPFHPQLSGPRPLVSTPPGVTIEVN